MAFPARAFTFLCLKCKNGVTLALVPCPRQLLSTGLSVPVNDTGPASSSLSESLVRFRQTTRGLSAYGREARGRLPHPGARGSRFCTSPLPTTGGVSGLSPGAVSEGDRRHRRPEPARAPGGRGRGGGDAGRAPGAGRGGLIRARWPRAAERRGGERRRVIRAH